MKVVLPMVALLATAITLPQAHSQHALFIRNDAIRRGKRETSTRDITNADQMVQNILQWLQGVYAQNSRRIRQGTFREYLPPTNTQKPRPFEPNGGGGGGSASNSEDNFIGYPPAGFSPNPPFIDTGDNNEQYVPPKTPYPTQKPSGFTSSSEGTTQFPGYPGGPTTTQFPGYPPAGSTPEPPFNGYPTNTPPPLDGSTTSTQPPLTHPPPTHPPETPPPQTYPPTTYPTYPPPTHPTQPPPTHPPSTYPTQPPTQPPPTHPPTTHPPQTPPPVTTYPPPGHIISTDAPFTTEAQAPGELHQTDPPPATTTDSNDIKTDSESSGTDDTAEALKHPPHIHAIDVECAKDMMTINIEFNRQFDGIIYSKGYYTNPECRYVAENSGQTKYSFTVSLNSCGTEFVNAFDTQGQSYLENVLVLQNEAGIQEVWDTIRAVRCLWEGNLNKALSVALSVGMLTQEIVTFSGDTAVAKLDIQLGRGPFAPAANGLVKIGDTMTLVVSVTGDPGFDIQVKDCAAKDGDGENVVALTDENGCVVKPKLFGAFQKTRNTGQTGASIIAYAFFSAFKFPDVMDLMIECNVELCKTDCEVCPDANQKLEPGRRRRRRDLYANANDTSLGEPIRMGKALRVILPEDLSDGEAIINLTQRQEVCLSTQSFVLSSAIMISLLMCSCLFSAYLWHKNQQHKF